MKWVSRWFRSPEVPRAMFTLIADSRLSIGESHATEQWFDAFAHFDCRSVPATWAVAVGEQELPLADRLIVSSIGHELAFDDLNVNFPSMVAGFRRQLQVARQIDVSLRTLVTRGAGVHPSLLGQLDIQAMVPIEKRRVSRTGLLRAIAWNQWEAPVTDFLSPTPSRSDVQRLHQRLSNCLRGATHLHLVWRLGASSSFGDLLPLLDRVADYHSRGWLHVETAGEAAAENLGAAMARAA